MSPVQGTLYAQGNTQNKRDEKQKQKGLWGQETLPVLPVPVFVPMGQEEVLPSQPLWEG